VPGLSKRKGASNGVTHSRARPANDGAEGRALVRPFLKRSQTRGPPRRNDSGLRVENAVARAPHLYTPLRWFCLSAFRLLAEADPKYAVEERRFPDGSSFYEYRPLIAEAIEVAAEDIARLGDVRVALHDVGQEPAAQPFLGDSGFERVLLPLLVRVAEACGGFDWSDSAFERAYLELEDALFADRRSYEAVAPLLGVSTPVPVDLGGGFRVVPDGRAIVLQLSSELRAAEPFDPAAELADAVTAMRLATGAAIALGPAFLERIHGRAAGRRPTLSISATTPGGAPTRLDEFRGRLARDLLARFPITDEDAGIGDALDLWELSLFEEQRTAARHLSGALTSLLGGPEGPWAAAVRASVLVAEAPQERAELFARLRSEPPDEQTVRRALVEVLVHGDRGRLIEQLDDTLLGARVPRWTDVRQAAG